MKVFNVPQTFAENKMEFDIRQPENDIHAPEFEVTSFYILFGF